jgi:hypothetical protein
MWRIRSFIQGIKNLIFFFKVVWNYRWWDYTYSLRIFKKSLEQCPENYRKYGLEVDHHLNPKIEKMERVIELLDIEVEGKHIEMIEEEWGVSFLDENSKSNKMFRRITEFEEETWNELWEIIKGTDSDGTSHFLHRIDLKEEENEDNSDYPNSDGTDMRSWWD